MMSDFFGSFVTHPPTKCLIFAFKCPIFWGHFRPPPTPPYTLKSDMIYGCSLTDHLPSNLLFLMVNLLALQVSQTTIPYIDSQPVAPQIGSWLSGVGLYHKGTSGSGGYVGAMIKTYDISRHLVSKKRDEQKETYILSK